MASRTRLPDSLVRRPARRARPRGGVARPAQGGGRPRHRRTCPPGPAASTSTATARSRPRSRGCGARRPASRSCATSSIERPTTARPASVATSTGCAGTTATTSRCPRAWIRPAGPPACVTSSTTATGWSRAGGFDSALRSAVTRLRLTNLPVALTVSHGNHGWILTGFRATADPAVTTAFRVTSVRVTGPLYGLQSKNGYDMAPNTKLTTAQLKRFFTPWKYAPKAMIWDGRYVSIQPVPKAVPAAAAPCPRRPVPRVHRRHRPRVRRPFRRRVRVLSRPRACHWRPVAAAVASSDPGAGAGAATGAVSSTGEALLPLWILLAGVTAICLVALVTSVRHGERHSAALR